jgi:hypothetical protein
VKRTVLLFITTIYLLSCLGIAVSSFYCCGILQSTTIMQIEDSKSDCKVVTKVPGCCKTKKQYLKVKDQHVASPVFSLNVNLFHTIIQTNYNLDLSPSGFNSAHSTFNSHAPPDWSNTPVYIRNCTYRI